MNHSELGTFIQKFKFPWKSGLKAHLHLEACAGQAWVNLNVQLGHKEIRGNMCDECTINNAEKKAY